MTNSVTIFGGNAISGWNGEGDGWSCNGLHVYIPQNIRPTAWFQLHRPEDLWKETPEHLAWLRLTHPFDLFMNNPGEEYPGALSFPFEECKKLWPLESEPSFSCSFSWMVAWAIVNKYDRISLRGVQMATPREAWLEAPNLMMWLGVAAGRGIEIDLDGRLAETFRYGLEPRSIPYWAPESVAQELIVDYFGQSRDWLDRWDYSRRGGIKTPVGPPEGV